VPRSGAQSRKIQTAFEILPQPAVGIGFNRQQERSLFVKHRRGHGAVTAHPERGPAAKRIAVGGYQRRRGSSLYSDYICRRSVHPRSCSSQNATGVLICSQHQASRPEVQHREVRGHRDAVRLQRRLRVSEGANAMGAD
jgi:hypothetical protein